MKNPLGSPFTTRSNLILEEFAEISGKLAYESNRGAHNQNRPLLCPRGRDHGHYPCFAGAGWHVDQSRSGASRLKILFACGDGGALMWPKRYCVDIESGHSLGKGLVDTLLP
jgi:hypothetical protein